MLRKLRSHKKSTRIVMILIVIALSVGLVSTYAFSSFSNLPDQPAEASDSNSAAGPDEVEGLIASISEQEAAVQADPQNALKWLGLAKTQYDLGVAYFSRQEWDASQNSFAQAYENYGKGLAIDPDNPQAKLYMAMSAFYGDQMDAARNTFAAVVQEAPDNVEAHLDYGFFLMTVDSNYQLAIEHLNKVLELSPQSDYAESAKQLIAVIQEEQQQQLQAQQQSQQQSEPSPEQSEPPQQQSEQPQPAQPE